MKKFAALFAFLICALTLPAQTGRVYTGVSPNTNSGNAGVIPRASTCPSNLDTILASDRAGLVTWTDSSACAVTLPQAGTAGFAFNFVFRGCNSGTGTVTVTPTTSTVSIWTGTAYSAAQTNIAITTGQCVSFYSDNTNYFANPPPSGGGSSGPLVAAITSKTSGYTLTSANGTVVFVCTSTCTATLPTTSLNTAQQFIVKNGSQTIAVTLSSSVNIDFATSQTLTPGQSMTVQWDGTQWWIE